MAAAAPTVAASSSSPVLSAAHRRRLNDVERDALDYGGPCDIDVDHDDDDGGGHRGHGAGAAGVRALFSSARRSKRASVVDQAWLRNVVVCLLGLTVVAGLVLSSHRVSGAGGGRLVQRMDLGDGEVMGWTEENLTAVARRSPDTPRRVGTYPLLRGLRVIMCVRKRSVRELGENSWRASMASRSQLSFVFLLRNTLNTVDISSSEVAGEALPSVSLSMYKCLFFSPVV